jgi:hypothetical protein
MCECDGAIYEACEKSPLSGGMTLRDYFAAAALQSVSCGIIAEANHGTTELSLAATAFNIADAMLAVRVESPIPQK